jgi:hypothetical protein
MLLDLLLIALLTAAGGVFLGIVLAILFFRLAVRPGKGRESSMPAAAMRGTVGCMGALVLLVTVLSVWGAVTSLLRPDRPSPPRVDVGQTLATPGIGDFIGGMQEVRRFREADSPEEAQELARALSTRLRGMGLDEDDVREMLQDLSPSGADWRAGIADWTLALPETVPGTVPPTVPQPGVAAEDTAVEAADTLPAQELDPEAEAERQRLLLVESLESYAALLEEMGPAADESEAALELRMALATTLASDTIEALQSRLSRETQDRVRAERALVAAADESTEPGIRAWLRSIAEDLGLGFGWGAVYFSVFLTWWKGRTPGKRLFGLRVVRLDGQPMSWWGSFERYGGYAAGFATGLLGFAQVYWDPNRQATHDRIAGTVVILEGRPPLPVGPVPRASVSPESTQTRGPG